jgi:Protein of unknown function (DUF4058)
MSSPFPGMDPYLEAPEIWRGFHHSLADEIKAQLNAKLSPRYYADVEVRTVLEEVGVATTKTVYPDAAILETVQATSSSATAVAIPAAPIQRLAMLPEEHKLRTVQVRETATDTLVTAIEILSPVNKRGDGLHLYRAKRKSLLRTDVHLIELDLLRDGERPGWEVKEPPLVCEYIVLVNRAFGGDMRRSEIWPVALDEPLPLCPVPLLPPDADVPLSLGEVVAQVYQRAAYARRIDYALPVPPPPLRPAMQRWLAAHLVPLRSK